MKSTILTLAAILVMAAIQAQSTFSVVHQGDSSTAGSGRAVFETEYGYLLFSAEVDSTTGFTWLVVSALDPTGGRIEAHTYSASRNLDAGVVDCVAENGDGTFTAAVSYFGGTEEPSMYLFHFSSNGDTISTHYILSDPYPGVRDCLRTPDGYYLIPGFATSSFDPPETRACLRKVTPTGELLWTRFWPEYLAFYTINPMEEGNYLVGGKRFTTQNADETVLLKVNGEGEQQWVRYIGGYTSGGTGRGTLMTNGNYLIPGSYLSADSADMDEFSWTAFYCYSPGGDLVWRRLIYFDRMASSSLSRSFGDGRYLVTSAYLQVPRDPDMATTFWWINNDGDTLQKRKYWYYGGYGALNPATYGMDLTSDGGAIFTGLARQGEDGEFPYRRYTWVLKLDEYGCLVPGCQNVGVQDYELALQRALSIHPNPASEQIAMALTLPDGYTVHGPVEALLLDAQGKEVLRQRVSNSTTELRTTLNVQHLPSGLYYLHLRDEVRWLAGGKVIVD